MNRFIVYMVATIPLLWIYGSYAQECGGDNPNNLCQKAYNTLECNYDSGDCCEDTCVPNPSTSWQCGVTTPYNCTDPRTPEPTLAPVSLAPTITRNPTIYQCDNSTIGNKRCNEVNNVAECDFDGGDCCQESCGGSIFCCEEEKMHLYPCICRDPDYVTPSPTAKDSAYVTFDEVLASTANIGHTEATSAAGICLDHGYDTFVSMGTWTEIASDDTTMYMTGTDYWADWYEYCAYNYTVSSCKAKVYQDPKYLYLMTWCCKSNIWVIAAVDAKVVYWFADEYDVVSRGPTFGFYGAGKSIEDVEIWYDWPNSEWMRDKFTAKSYDMTCTATGSVVAIVVACLMLAVFLFVAIRFCVKNKGNLSCGALMDGFEAYSSKIELVVQGIALGDSFVASLIVSIDLGLPSQGAGIIVMTFGIVNLILFLVRFKLSKTHILESENFGQLSDFTFDFCMSVFLIFMNYSLNGDNVLPLIIASYMGVAEELIQFVQKLQIKWLNKALDYYLTQSGRVLTLFNMFVLMVTSLMYFTYDYARPEEAKFEFAAMILIISLVMFSGCIYSLYAYVGCCGKGGHKKPVKKEDGGDEEAKGDKDEKAKDEDNGKTNTGAGGDDKEPCDDGTEAADDA